MGSLWLPGHISFLLSSGKKHGRLSALWRALHSACFSPKGDQVQTRHGASKGSEVQLRGTGSISSVSTASSVTDSGSEQLALCVAKGGNLPNEMLQKAAARLIRTEPGRPESFAIPSRGKATGKAPSRGVPLKYLASCPEVAWEFNGQLQPLIGAVNRTGQASAAILLMSGEANLTCFPFNWIRRIESVFIVARN
eukprot:s1379_g7.t1